MILEQIQKLKEELGNQVVIPVHHYQAKEIVELGDFVGDSYKLAVECSKTDAAYVVFCGVLFMAECADILRKGEQKVVIPAAHADCPMASMADLRSVTEVYDKLKERLPEETQIAPVVYMNSYADLKSFCGEHGGSVCTSSNAHLILKHYLDAGKKVLFFPDYNLGINTARTLGLTGDRIIGSKNVEQYHGEDVILWEGFCPIHTRFSLSDIKTLRQQHPGIRILVHPECPKEIVEASDESGSTEYILKQISASPAGTTWGVGTETVFVNRLAAQFPDRNILPLRISECVNMKKTTLETLLSTLQNIKEHITSKGNTPLNHLVVVNKQYRKSAATSLQKMISIVEQAKK